MCREVIVRALIYLISGPRISKLHDTGFGLSLLLLPSVGLGIWACINRWSILKGISLQLQRGSCRERMWVSKADWRKRR